MKHVRIVEGADTPTIVRHNPNGFVSGRIATANHDCMLVAFIIGNEMASRRDWGSRKGRQKGKDGMKNTKFLDLDLIATPFDMCGISGRKT